MKKGRGKIAADMFVLSKMPDRGGFCMNPELDKFVKYACHHGFESFGGTHFA